MFRRLVLLGAFIMLSTVLAYAASVQVTDINGVGIDERGFSTYTVKSTATQYYYVAKSTLLSDSTTVRILGYSVHPNAAVYDKRVTLYDDDSTNVARSLILNESEQVANHEEVIWFPYPRKLTYGLVLFIGAYCDVNIYYTK